MAIQVQIRRGTTSENNAFTGAQGEVTVNTINNSLRIHDGETVGGHIVLGESQITNCITEIPQDIKLELNNGALTLKAGSKLYIPNGVGVFDDGITTVDKTPGLIGPDGIYLCYSSIAGSSIYPYLLSQSGSGSSLPADGSQYTIFYNTTDNKIYQWGIGSSSWQAHGVISLPVAIVTVSSGAITSIDQVFNGLGYIGSTIFALPGVSGLTANGQNNDGTWRSSTFTLTSVKILNIAPYTTIGCPLALNASGFIYETSYFEQETNPGTNYSLWYNLKTNYLYQSVSTASFNAINAAVIGTFDRTNGIVSNLRIKQAFHAVDYNDAVLKNMNQDIIGGKYFSGNIYKKMTSYAYTEIPSTQTFNTFYGADKDNKIYGAFEFIKNTDGSNAAQMNIKGINGSWTSTSLGIGVTSTGDTFTYAPTPTSVYSNNNAIATTEHIIAVLDKIYPVGAIYISTTTSCPLAAFFGTWELVEYGDVLQTGNGTVGDWSLVNTSNTGAWNVVAPSLPNTTGVFDGIPYTAAWNATNVPMSGSGALYNAGGSAGTMHITTSQGANQNVYKLGLNLSSSSSYYSNTDTQQPVQPRALVVNVWRRTA